MAAASLVHCHRDTSAITGCAGPPSDGVHKGLFDAVEEQHAEQQGQQHDAQAVEQVQGVQFAGAQEGEAEAFDDGGERVELDIQAVLLGDGGERVDDRGGVHPQLHAKADQEAQVAVAGGQGGDDDAEAQSEAGHHQQQQGGDQHPDVGLHRASRSG